MDILELLENDHDDLQALLIKLPAKHGTEARHLFAEIKYRLLLHEKLEEECFYQPLRENELTVR
jgi:hypothetical protein